MKNSFKYGSVRVLAFLLAAQGFNPIYGMMEDDAEPAAAGYAQHLVNGENGAAVQNSALITQLLHGLGQHNNTKMSLEFPYDHNRPAFSIPRNFGDTLLALPTADTHVEYRVCLTRIADEDLPQEEGFHNMNILLRELWGEDAIWRNRQLVFLEDKRTPVIQRVPFLLERLEERHPHPMSFGDYLRSPNRGGDNYAEQLDLQSLQRMLMASILINPHDANEEMFIVDRERKVYPVGAFQAIDIPFIQTRFKEREYQLNVNNILYVSEFARSDREEGRFASDLPIDDLVKRPFLEKTAEEILLGWLSCDAVNKRIFIRGSSGSDRNISLLDHFIRIFNSIKNALREREGITIRELMLMPEIQPEVVNKYENLKTKLNELDSPTRASYLYQELSEHSLEPEDRGNRVAQDGSVIQGDPVVPVERSAAQNEQDVYERYREYSFLPAISGSVEYSRLFYNLVMNRGEEEVIPILNSLGADYLRRNPNALRDKSRIKIENLRPEGPAPFMGRIYSVLNNDHITGDALKFAVLLGFDINSKNDQGLTLLHQAIYRNSAARVNALFEVPQLQGETLSTDEYHETPLDTAIRGQREDVFKRLVDLRMGLNLDSPENAHAWYLELQRAGQLTADLREYFKALALRNQKLRWLVVLEEVFPRAEEAEPVINQPLSTDELMARLGEYFVRSGSFIDYEAEDYEREKTRYERSLAAYQQAHSPDNEKQLIVRKKVLGEFLKRIAERILGDEINPHLYSDGLTAAINLGLEPEEHQNNPLSPYIRRIKERIKMLLGPDSNKYDAYCQQDETKHIAKAMELKAVQRAYPDILNMDAFYAMPLLAGYLEITEKARGSLRNEAGYQRFWSAFQRNDSLMGYEREFLSTLTRLNDDHATSRILDVVLDEAYNRLTNASYTVQTAENGVRRICSDVHLKLWKGGIFQRENKCGLCKVQSIRWRESLLGENGVLFVKQYPQVPGFEAAASKFLLRLMGSGAPYSDLFNIRGEPYLVSQGFIEEGGNLFEKAEEDRPLLEDRIAHLDPIASSKLAIGTMLISPEDGTLHNAVLARMPDDHEHFQIINVDNDHAFEDVVGSNRLRDATKEKQKIHTKTFLFAMKSVMTAPIPPQLIAYLSQINIANFFELWLGDLIQLDRSYNALFPDPGQRAILLGKGSNVIIPLTEKMVMGVYDRFSFMQEVFKNVNGMKVEVTHKDLLADIMPILASPERYGRFWTQDSPYQFLDDPEIFDMSSSQIASYYGSHQLPTDRRMVDIPLDQRTYRAEVHLATMRARIAEIEHLEQHPTEKTLQRFNAFQSSAYQQKRFLRGFELRGADKREENQRAFLHLLMDPQRPMHWLELENFDALSDDDFVFGEPTGDDRGFVVSNLRHLVIPGSSRLTPQCLERIWTFGIHLTYLDLSRTYTSQNIHIRLLTLRTLKINKLLPEDKPKKIKIEDPTGEFLELIESDDNTADGTSLAINARSLRRLSIEGMPIDDDALECLLFEKGRVFFSRDSEGRKVKKFPDLVSMNLKGTRVTLPEIRGLLPSQEKDDVLKAYDRICKISTKDAKELLDSLHVDDRRVMGWKGVFIHTGHFMKNFIGGIFHDLHGLAKFVVSGFKKVFKKKSDEEVAQFSAGAVVSNAVIGAGITIRLAATAGEVASFVTPAGTVIEAATVATASLAATGIGAAVSGTIWAIRAAYWEHQRINNNILLAQRVIGMTIRSALDKLPQKEHFKDLKLSERNLGDAGIIAFLTFSNGPETPSFGDLVSVDLRANGITDHGAVMIREALRQDALRGLRTLTELKLELNLISDAILGEINVLLLRNKQEPHVVEAQEGDARREGACEYHPSQDKETYFGLSIDGGGMRGLIPVASLKVIERLLHEVHGLHVRDLPACIGGASIGGIAALSLARDEPLSPSDLIKLFIDKGKKIFGKRSGIGLFKAKYSPKPLEEILKENFEKGMIFKEDINLSESVVDVIVPAVRTDCSNGLESYTFDSSKAKQDPMYDFKMRDVARATSAAPVFFPQAHIRDLSPQETLHSFWDGGVWRNDPADLVYDHLVRLYPGHPIQILSLGTGQVAPAYGSVRSEGFYGNFSALLYGQMDLSANVSERMIYRLGEDNYLRIQPSLRRGGRALRAPLDDFSPDLLTFYQESVEEIWREDGRLAEFIRRMIEKGVHHRNHAH